MKFTELEKLMLKSGVNTLADIARALETTPQAVSNWKSRDQVPYHIVTRINMIMEKESSPQISKPSFANQFEGREIGIPDILLTLAEQLKVIIIIPFITIFLTFTYVMFIQSPLYVSAATILLPGGENAGGMGGALSGFASQFGVNVPSKNQGDLSSPYLFPELFKSRTFAEKVLEQEVFNEESNKTISLLELFTSVDENSTNISRDILISRGMGAFRGMVQMSQDAATGICVITVTSGNSQFSKKLAEIVIDQIEDMNRFYKSKSVREKLNFINERVKTVENDLNKSEQALRLFRERNQQISSPALQLESERLNRELEIQKTIYLTLKQQLELVKIEEVQKSSIIQILDKPQMPLSPSNKNIKNSVMIAGIFGIGLGILIAFFRSFVMNSDVDEKRKFRRTRNFLKKKTKDVFEDPRISGTVSFLLFIGLPYYLGHQSKNPTFFGMYSNTLMLINTLYILFLLFSIVLFFRSWKKNK